MSEHVSESGHWYHRDGTPCYEIEGKGGKMRPTTLRDARKLGLVPSVTSIIRLAAAPGLVNWQIEQAILASLTLPRVEGETDEQFIARVRKDAAEQALKARERGTQIHAWIQEWFDDSRVADEALPFCESANRELYEACGNQDWLSEQAFATDRFGGKADLHCPGFLIDIKTTDKDLGNLKLWPEHEMQLAAYIKGLWQVNIRRAGILFVNSITAESRLIWATQEELERGWRCFDALVDFFYAKTGLEAKG